MWCGKIFRKRPVWSRVEGTFSLNEKNQYRNIQLSYLPSKGPRNLFLGLLERPKCQIIFFSGTKHSGYTHGGTSTTSNTSFQSRCT